MAKKDELTEIAAENAAAMNPVDAVAAGAQTDPDHGRKAAGWMVSGLKAENIWNYGGRQDVYRFNLKMPMAFKEYLDVAVYNESKPGKKITVTSYLNNLILKDIIEHTK